MRATRKEASSNSKSFREKEIIDDNQEFRMLDGYNNYDKNHIIQTGLNLSLLVAVTVFPRKMQSTSRARH